MLANQDDKTWWEPPHWQERRQWQERQDWHGWLTSHSVVNRLLLLTLDRNPGCVDDDGTVSCKGFVIGQLPTPVSNLGGALPKKHTSRARVPPPSTQSVATAHHVIEIRSGIDAKSVATVWPVVCSTRNWTQWSGPPRLREMRTRVDNDDEHFLRLVVSEMQCPRPTRS